MNLPDEPDARDPLRIIVADDHQLIREAVKPYVRALCDDVIIHEAANYAEILNIAASATQIEERIDLAVIDLGMPDEEEEQMEGLRRVCKALPSTGVVVFSARDDAATIVAALRNGARGYVPKSVHGRSLTAALKLVLEGEIYIPVEAMRALVDAGRAAGQSTYAEEPTVLLSPQERRTVDMLVQGMSNKEIARAMAVQEVTVKMHLRNAYRKLGASNRTSAVRIAIEKGLARAG